MKIRLAIHGCDDSTYLDLDVTTEQKVFLEMLVKMSEDESSSVCMPVLYLEDSK